MFALLKFQQLFSYIIVTITSVVYVHLKFGRFWPGFKPFRVKQKTIKLVFAVSPLNMQYKGVRTKTGRHGMSTCMRLFQ